MKEVKWESLASPDHVHGHIGCVRLYCRMVETATRKKRWYGQVWINGCGARFGQTRHSLTKAKDDCILLAYEIMLDYREGLKEELKNFDLELE